MNLAVDPACDERFDHGDQLPLAEGGYRLRACLHGRSRRRVIRLDPQQHLPAIEPHPRDRGRVVPGEPVVDLEHRADEAAPVHRTDHHLALESAEQQQVLKHVGGAENAADAWPG